MSQVAPENQNEFLKEADNFWKTLDEMAENSPEVGIDLESREGIQGIHK